MEGEVFPKVLQGGEIVAAEVTNVFIVHAPEVHVGGYGDEKVGVWGKEVHDACEKIAIVVNVLQNIEEEAAGDGRGDGAEERADIAL